VSRPSTSRKRSPRTSPRKNRPPTPPPPPQAPPLDEHELQEQELPPPFQPSEPELGPETDTAAAGEPDETGFAFPAITEETIRAVLDATGKLLHQAAGRTPTHWLFLDEELDVICAPLARRARKSSMLRRVAGSSDAYVIALCLAAYGIRNVRDMMPATETEEDDVGPQVSVDEGASPGGDGRSATDLLTVPAADAPG
jgi:hypothetical protein